MRKAVALGLSVIFISHKLHEVMAISSRVVVLRHGKLVAEAKTAETDRARMAQMMVGTEVAAPVRPAVPIRVPRWSRCQTSLRLTAAQHPG